MSKGISTNNDPCLYQEGENNRTDDPGVTECRADLRHSFAACGRPCLLHEHKANDGTFWVAGTALR